MPSSALTDPHLVLAWATVRFASFPDRVAAAADAGFHSIGMRVSNYLELRRSGWSDEDLRAVLRHHDVTIDEVDVLYGFCAEPGPANVPDRPGMVYADPEAEQTAFHLADVFGARRVLALGTFDCRPVGPDVVRAFAALCDRAASHSMQVALEFTPYSNIPDVRTASQVVAAADRPNGGLCVDAWHFFRGSADYDDLAALDVSRTFVIQFNDGPATPIDPDLRADAIHNRRCPGQGDFDLERFLRTLDQPGLDAPVSVEIFDDRLDRQTTSEAVHAAATSTRDVFARLDAREPV